MTGDSRVNRVFLGGALFVHFVALCAVKLLHRQAPQILWLSNVTILITAFGLFTRSRSVLATALVSVLIPHLLWIADFCARQQLGRSPLGLTGYLENESRWLQITSGHHFYLVPMLMAWFWRAIPCAAVNESVDPCGPHNQHGAEKKENNSWPRESWLYAATGFVLLSLICRGLLPVADNVNFAYFVPSRLDLWPFCVLTGWPEPVYLLGLHVAMNLLAFGPAYCLSRRLFAVHS